MFMSSRTNAEQPVVARNYNGDEDFWKVRDLLIETYLIAPPGLNWAARRWDGQRFHRENLAITNGWQLTVRLWETGAGRVVGAVHPEGAGEAYLEIHPNYRFLENEMLAWAEQNLTAEGKLHTTAYMHDTTRINLLIKRGYERTAHGVVTRRMFLQNRDLSAPEFAAGYTIRTTQRADSAAMAALLNISFGRNIHTAQEYQNFSAYSPSFDHTLNFVAVAPDGSLAAHVGVNLVRENNYAVIEPVCTHPDHRRQGLARALLSEGLRKLQQIGVDTAFVDTGADNPANQLYDLCGFEDTFQGYVWAKSL
jgi:mycothiol synthase